MKKYICPTCVVVGVTSEGSLLTGSPVVPVGPGTVDGTDLDSNRAEDFDTDWED